MRLDLKLSKEFGFSREVAKNLIETGKVLVNGNTILKPSFKVLEEGIEVKNMPQAKPSSLKPSEVPLDIIFEDEFLMVINKQAGVSTHPASIYGTDTIANGVINFFEEEGLRPGIVHRLDKETTGLLLIAKTEEAKQTLSKMIAERSVERRYLAICYGNFRLPSFQINANLIRDTRNRQKMRVCKTSGKEAVTNVLVLESFFNGIFSLVELKLETGRTHQIRVHLSHFGNPVVGDQIYGQKPPSFFEKFKPNPELFNALINTKRQMLHAFSLKFLHPFTGEELSLKAEAPTDFTYLLSQFK